MVLGRADGSGSMHFLIHEAGTAWNLQKVFVSWSRVEDRNAARNSEVNVQELKVDYQFVRFCARHADHQRFAARLLVFTQHVVAVLDLAR